MGKQAPGTYKPCWYAFDDFSIRLTSRLLINLPPAAKHQEKTYVDVEAMEGAAGRIGANFVGLSGCPWFE